MSDAGDHGRGGVRMRYVVIGSSAAGINAVRELRKIDQDSRIILISKDKSIYSRCILHHYLGGERSLDRLCFAEKDFESVYRIDWMKGRECTAVKPGEKQVVLDGGETVDYDKLLIATGSHTFVPPVKNLKEAKNVTGFRNIEDMEVLKAAAENCRNIVLMGSGLVGLDCASGFLALGVPVTLVEMAGWLLSRQLDERAASTYQKAYEAKGVRQYYGVGMSEVVLDGQQNITEAVLTDGTRIPCDFVVVTAGVRSNVEFLEGSGIELSKFGLVYDETGRTSDPDIYGAGDVSGTSPIWPAAVKEGIVAASNMAGVPRKMTDFFASKSTMNFLGIPTMSLGDVNPEAARDGYTVEMMDTGDTYKKIIHKGGKITGAILQGDLAYGGILQQLIARHIDITRVKKPVFDIDYSDFFREKENFEFYYEDE
jgi:NAD(P)H-nitrite reductase large subunit